MADTEQPSVSFACLGHADPAPLRAVLARLGVDARSVAAAGDPGVAGVRLLWIDAAAELEAQLTPLSEQLSAAGVPVLVLGPSHALDRLDAAGAPAAWDLVPWPCADAVLDHALRRARRHLGRGSGPAVSAPATLERALDAGLIEAWEWSPGAREGEESSPLDRIRRDERERVRSLLRDALAHGERFAVSCRLEESAGRGRSVLLLAAPSQDVALRGLKVPGLMVHLTALLQHDVADDAARARLQESLVAANMCLWSYCEEQDRYLIDGAVMQVLGVHPRSLRELRALDHPDDAAWASYYFTAAASGRRPLNMEHRVVRPDGEIRWVSVSAAQVAATADSPAMLRGRLIDITERKEAELQNYELAERLGVALDAAGLSPWSVDLRTQVHVPGPRDVELFGRQILTREMFESQVLEEDRPLVQPLRDRAAVADGEVVAAEYRIRHLDGSLRWLSTRARCSFDVQGLPEKLVGVTFDITARKAAEAELLQSRQRLAETSQRLSQALEAAGMSTLDLPLTQAGLPGPAALRDSFGTVLDADLEALSTALAGLNVAGRPFDHTYRVHDPDHGVRWKQAVGRREPGRGGGERVAGVIMDVTERRMAEAALNESRRWRDLAVEGAGLSVWEADLTTGARQGSRMDVRLYGFSPVRTDEIEALLHPDDRALSASAWSRAVDEGAPYSVELRVQAPDGTYRWIAVHARPLADELTGRRIMAGITMDIDDRKRAEREQQEALRLARQASETKSAFLASMSHEIRTPLNAVIGFTGLLADSRLDPQQTTYVQTLRSSAQLLLGLINDILDFSRIEAGEIPIEDAPFSLIECIETSLDFVATQAESKGLYLLALAEGEVARRVTGDVTRVRQVVVNLLSNAVKFTESGGVICELSVHDRGGSARVQVRMRDSGIGMDDATLARLFQPFQQGDASTTRRFGGTGLGLSICSRLVQLMHGSIDVRSEPGNGSEFVVDLPLRWAEPPAPEPVPLRARSVAVALQRAPMRRAIAVQLAAFGLEHELLDPEQLRAFLHENGRCDVLLLSEALLARVEEHSPYPRNRSGEPLPLVVLVGIEDEPSIGHGRHGQHLVRLPRTLKPTRLRESLDAACPRDDSNPPVWLQRMDSTLRPPAEPRTALRVLIAEDNAVNQMLLRLQVESLGHRVQVVSSGVEALQAIEIDSFDVILMDVEMPDLDGIETARAIRTRPDPGEQPHIVAVTAHATQDMRLRLQAAGMDDFIAKPVLREALVAALGRVPVRAS